MKTIIAIISPEYSLEDALTKLQARPTFHIMKMKEKYHMLIFAIDPSDSILDESFIESWQFNKEKHI